MSKIKKFLLSILLCLSITTLPISTQIVSAGSSMAFIVLSQYKANADIGTEFYIIAVTSNGKLPTWKSSNSKIASVNTYGKVTVKKAGTATITAKINHAEASCKVTANKTTISLKDHKTSIENGDNLILNAKTSNGSVITWTSSKKSVAVIDEKGVITAKKPGKTTITAKADGTEKSFVLTVKLPIIKLSQTKVSLYRSDTIKLSATVSSDIFPTWKTNKKSVAIVDSFGNITAIKHGTATITATVDGRSKTCEVVVKQPEITLSTTELTIKNGQSETISAKVSSGKKPVWSTSNPKVVTINSSGKVTGIKKGKAYVYASEDGIKIKCTIYVTD